jgi:hypothetical protein
LLSSTNPCIKLPPAGIRPLIKRLTLVVELCRSEWDELEPFSKTGWGFKNTTDLTIKFRIDTFLLLMGSPTFSLLGPMLDRPLFFPCNGQALLNGSDPGGDLAKGLARISTDLKALMRQFGPLLDFAEQAQDTARP